MESTLLKIEKEAQVITCWLNRPEKRNALNVEMLGELIGLFREVAEDKQARILVLRGSGEVFSAGADLSQISDVSGKKRTESFGSGVFKSS